MIAQKSCTLAPLNLDYPVDINSMQLPLLIEVPMYPPPTPPAPTGIMSRLWYGLGSLYSSVSSNVLGLPAQEGTFYCGLEKRTPNPDFFWPALPPCPGDDGNDSDDSDIYVTCDSGDDDDDEETPTRQGLLDLTNASSKRKGRHGNGDEDPERRVSKRPRLFVNINKRKTMEDENDDNDHAAKRQHLGLITMIGFFIIVVRINPNVGA